MLSYLNILLLFLGIRYSKKQTDREKRESISSSDPESGTGSRSPPGSPSSPSEYDTCFGGIANAITYRPWRYIGYFYSLCILCMICVQPFIIIQNGRRWDNKSMYSSGIYMLIGPINYIISMVYFSKKYFDEIYQDVQDNSRKCFIAVSERTLTTSIVVMAVISALTSGIMLAAGVPIVGQDMDQSLFRGRNLLLVFANIFDWLYARPSILLNIHIFVYVFIKHYKEIKYMAEELDRDAIWTNDQTKIATICHDLMIIRFQLEKSVKNLQSLYVFPTIVGAIAIGYLKDHPAFNVHIVSYTALYVVIQVVFLSIMFNVSKNKNQLTEIIKKPSFSMRYILRKYKIQEYHTGIPVPQIISTLRSDRIQTQSAMSPILSSQSKREEMQLMEITLDSNILASTSGLKKKPVSGTDLNGMLFGDVSMREISTTSPAHAVVARNTSADRVKTIRERMNAKTNSIEMNELGTTPNSSSWSYSESGAGVGGSRAHSRPMLAEQGVERVNTQLTLGETFDEYMNGGGGNMKYTVPNTLRGGAEGSIQTDCSDYSDNMREFKHMLKEEQKLREHEREEYRTFNPEICIKNNYILQKLYSSVKDNEFTSNKVHEIVDSNGSSTDWLILNEILSEKWATFGLMGINFDDGTGILRILTLTGLLITATSYLDGIDFIFSLI